MTDTTLRRTMIALATLGVGIASYLTWVHYAGIEPLCAGGGGGCEKVQTSSYAELGGLSVAVLGLAGYLGILATLFLRGEASLFGGAFLTVAGFGFTGYLTWAELFRIHAICQWCVASAIVMTSLTALAITRLLRAEPELVGEELAPQVAS